MSFYFLREDMAALNERINALNQAVMDNLKEMGESCGEGAETFHDNFRFEAAERAQEMAGDELKKLIETRNQSRIVDSKPLKDQVTIGYIVTIKDLSNGETSRFKIGSYMTFPKSDDSLSVYSYNAPLVQIIMGAKIGEKRKGIIGVVEKEFEILELE